MHSILIFSFIFTVLIIPISSAQYEYYNLWNYKNSYIGDISSNSILVADDDKIMLFDLTGKRIMDKQLGEIQKISISSNGNYIVAHYEKENFKLQVLNNKAESVWERNSFVNDYIESPDGDSLISIDISSNGEFTAFSEGNSNIHLFDISGQVVWSYTADDIIRGDISISDDGSMIVAATEKKLYLFNNNGDRLIEKTYKGSIQDSKISPNGEYIAVLIDNKIEPYYSIELLDNKGRLLSRPYGIYWDKVSVDNNGRIASMAPGYNKIVIIDSKGNIESTIENLIHSIDVEFSPNGDYLLVGDKRKQSLLVFAKDQGTLTPDDGEIVEISKPTFKWNGTGALKYIIKIDDKEYTASTNEFTPAEPLSAGNHTWAVKSIDVNGKESTWSRTKNFLITAKEKTVTEKIAVDDPRTNYVWIAAIVIGIIIAGFFTRPYYKRARLKQEMGRTPTDWCTHCKKFTGGLKVCPHCGHKTLIETKYDTSKKVKKK